MNNNENQDNVNPFLSQSDKGSDSIVVQLGSHSIKFGLASQYQPFIIPNVIAHLIHKEEKKEQEEDAMVELEVEDNEISDSFLSSLVNIEQDILKKEIKTKTAKKLAMMNSAKNITTKPQNSISERPERVNEQIPGSTASYKKMQSMSLDLNDDILNNNFKWTSLSTKPEYLIGREALCIPDNIKDYELRYPIKFGYFNNEYSVHGVLDDLHKILSFCFEEVLKISKNDIRNYNIVLLLPDVFIKMQVKLLVNLFLKVFGFKNIFLHLESVMSTFGLAVQSACVVDIGDNKINICCVDEGIMLDDTLIRKNYGGAEITKLLYLLLKQTSKTNEQQGNKSFPYEFFNINDHVHFRIFEKLKENECEFPSVQSAGLGMAQFVPKNSNIWLHQKGQNTKVINFTLVEAAYIPPLCLFFPEIIQTYRNKVKPPTIDFYNDITGEYYTDPEDLMGELLKTFANAEKKEDQNAINNIGLSGKKSVNNDEDSLSQTPSKSEDANSSMEDKNANKKNTYESMFDTTTGLDDLICQSLMNISNKDLRKKLANAIILVGGSSKIKGFIDYLEDRLINKLSLLDNEIERVEIFNYPDIDMKTLAWIGGSILPKLDSAKDMWIQRERWLGEPERIDEVPVKEKEKKEEKEEEKDKEKEADNSNVAQKSEAKPEKKKKVERHLDGGVKLIREKCPFAW